jgi:hypothetical protein
MWDRELDKSEKRKQEREEKREHRDDGVDNRPPLGPGRSGVLALLTLFWSPCSWQLTALKEKRPRCWQEVASLACIPLSLPRPGFHANMPLQFLTHPPDYRHGAYHSATVPEYPVSWPVKCHFPRTILSCQPYSLMVPPFRAGQPIRCRDQTIENSVPYLELPDPPVPPICLNIQGIGFGVLFPV